ncbi:BREX system P-loop protein BrxC [Terrisporobacter glycolicus]|nr:BREX system P-loop protein BrxC [Terrisporobacter glycolicus]
MVIKDIFRNRIERYINPVIKVQEDDINVAKEELQEYVITEQLRGHFKECLDQYFNNHNKVGYWVSGWFGSGKSHFLKIFGYLLENHCFEDEYAADIFLRRDDTNILRPVIENINNSYKTTVVMFDILEEAGKLEGKVEPIEQTIYKQWLAKQGFYTAKLWVAEMEKELFDEGKYDEFVSTIEEMSGRKWKDLRKARLAQNYIQKTLVKVLQDQIPTESIAKDYINDMSKSKVISASMLADELLKYVNRLDELNGLNNRLFVIVDEIGQYISTNPDVIGYLQAIESTFARKGKGKLWLAVSSQNKLDQITEQFLKSDDDINKVKDRFEVRVHLTPENLDKVINERVLKKKSDAIKEIEDMYEKNKGKLTSILEFKDFKKYIPKSTKDDFVNAYPFMPYQIKLIQPIYYNVISKSKVNKKLGGTNRSMIQATQGIIKDDITDFKNKDIGELVTLDMFFDQAKEFIDDQMQISIKEASNIDNENGEFLVKILKVLYLLENDDTLPKNADTISKLLINNVNADYISCMENVNKALDILYKQGYVERDTHGNYKFISPEEQGFRQEAILRRDEIGVRDRNRKIKEITDEIFSITRVNYKNIKVFDIQMTIDDEVRTNKGIINLNLNSVMQSDDEGRKERDLIDSISFASRIYWYAKYDNTIDYEIQEYLIFKKIIEEYKRKWNSDEDKIYFLRKEEQKNIKLLEDIKEKINKSFKRGTYIYQGKEFPVPEKNDIKIVFENIVSIPIPYVYNRFDMVGRKVTKEDIANIFKNNQLSIDLNNLNLMQDTNINAESAVLKEVVNEIKRLKNRNGQCTGKDLLSLFDDQPYGWASEAVRLFTALLFKNGNIELNYEGKDFLDYNQSGIRDIFENEPNFRKATFKPAVVVDAATRQKCQDILKNSFGINSDDTLVELYKNTRDILNESRNKLSALKQIIITQELPLKESINELDDIFIDILNSKTQGDTINEFVQRQVKYADLLFKYNKLRKFNDNGNVIEYDKMKKFLNDVWIIESDHDKEEDEIYKQIISDLDSESFIDLWTSIRENYYKLYTPYVKEYTKTHDELNNTYELKIKEFENNKSFLSLNSEIDKSNILNILENMMCRSTEGKEIPCSKCKLLIRDMKTRIDAVEVYYDKARDKMYEYLTKQIDIVNNGTPTGGGTIKPAPVTKKISTNTFPKGDLIQTHKDVKKYLKRIENQLIKDIEDGNRIIIE